MFFGTGSAGNFSWSQFIAFTVLGQPEDNVQNDQCFPWWNRIERCGLPDVFHHARAGARARNLSFHGAARGCEALCSETRHVAKLVKSFGRLEAPAESLDDFRYTKGCF